MSNSKSYWMGILGAAVVAGSAALFYLAQDDDKKVVEYNPKVHTREKFLEIMEELELEYTSLFVHWHIMLKTKTKEMGEASSELLQAAKVQIEELMEKIDSQVLNEHELDETVFNQWMEKHANDPSIMKIKSSIEKNHEKCLAIQPININYTIPEGFTKEIYKKYIRAAYEKFRFDVYNKTQEKLKETGEDRLSDDEFGDILKNCNLQEIKYEAYKRLGIPDVPGEKHSSTTLKAYILYSNEDVAWHTEILTIQRHHKTVLFEIPEGKKLSSMHEDPLDVLEKEVALQQNIKEQLKNPDAHMIGGKANKEESKQKGDGDAKPSKDEKSTSYSFMGSKQKQEDLIREFLERGKKQKETKQEAADDSKHNDKPEDKKAEENKGEEPNEDAKDGQHVEEAHVEESHIKADDHFEDIKAGHSTDQRQEDEHKPQEASDAHEEEKEVSNEEQHETAENVATPAADENVDQVVQAQKDEVKDDKEEESEVVEAPQQDDEPVTDAKAPKAEDVENEQEHPDAINEQDQLDAVQEEQQAEDKPSEEQVESNLQNEEPVEQNVEEESKGDNLDESKEDAENKKEAEDDANNKSVEKGSPSTANKSKGKKARKDRRNK